MTTLVATEADWAGLVAKRVGGTGDDLRSVRLRLRLFMEREGAEEDATVVVVEHDRLSCWMAVCMVVVMKRGRVLGERGEDCEDMEERRWLRRGTVVGLLCLALATVGDQVRSGCSSRRALADGVECTRCARCGCERVDGRVCDAGWDVGWVMGDGCDMVGKRDKRSKRPSCVTDGIWVAGRESVSVDLCTAVLLASVAQRCACSGGPAASAQLQPLRVPPDRRVWARPRAGAHRRGVCPRGG